MRVAAPDAGTNLTMPRRSRRFVVAAHGGRHFLRRGNENAVARSGGADDFQEGKAAAEVSSWRSTASGVRP